MKRNIYILVCIAIFVFNGVYAQTYSGGSGTVGDPYLIANKSDLKYLSENSGEWTKHFKQTTDISFYSSDFEAGGDFYNGGEGFTPIGNMTNVFDGSYGGSGFTIDGLYINNTSVFRVGFFGSLNTNAQVFNLGLTSVDVTGDSYVGGLAGYSSAGYGSGFISQCYVTGNIQGTIGADYIGGLVGYCDGSVLECYSSADVDGDTYVGSLIGVTDSGIITDSYATGTVSGNSYVAGLVGGAGYIVENCYSTGFVTGGSNTGGLVANGSTFVTNSFWDTQTSGQATSTGGTGKTTIEMQALAIFTSAGWDFVGETTNGTADYWDIDCPNNNGYPILSWQSKSTFFIGDGTSGNPYEINTKNDLKILSENSCLWDKYFIQTADIVFDATDFQSSGDFYNNGIGFMPIGTQSVNFLGNYDGNGYSIENLYINRPVDYHNGLIGFLGSGGAITKLNMVNVDFMGQYNVGGIVGYNRGTVSECNTSGSLTATQSSAGGIVGFNIFGTISNCYSKVNVASTTSRAGGITGYNDTGTITNSYSVGAVSSPATVGGLAGGEESGTVNNSFWNTETSGQSSSAGGIGKTTAEMQLESTYTSATWDFIDETSNGTADVWQMNACTNDGYPIFSWQALNALPLNTISESGNTLTADEAASGATYQWLDCGNGNAAISGATSQSFSPGASGNYAVEVTLSGCASTSNCTTFSYVGIDDLEGTYFSIYPNPVHDVFAIEFSEYQSRATISVLSIRGEIIISETINNAKVVELNLQEPSGIYFIEIFDHNHQKSVFKLVKQ